MNRNPIKHFSFDYCRGPTEILKSIADQREGTPALQFFREVGIDRDIEILVHDFEEHIRSLDPLQGALRSVGGVLGCICCPGGDFEGSPHIFQLGFQPSPSYNPESKSGKSEQRRKSVQSERVFRNPFVGTFPAVVFGALLGGWFLYFIGVIPRMPYRKERKR